MHATAEPLEVTHNIYCRVMTMIIACIQTSLDKVLKKKSKNSGNYGAQNENENYSQCEDKSWKLKRTDEEPSTPCNTEERSFYQKAKWCFRVVGPDALTWSIPVVEKRQTRKTQESSKTTCCRVHCCYESSSNKYRYPEVEGCICYVYMWNR